MTGKTAVVTNCWESAVQQYIELDCYLFGDNAEQRKMNEQTQKYLVSLSLTHTRTDGFSTFFSGIFLEFF